MQRILTYFVRGSVTMQLTSCLARLDSVDFLILKLSTDLLGLNRNQSTGGQPVSDTSLTK